MELGRKQYWMKWKRQSQDSRCETIGFCTISEGALVGQGFWSRTAMSGRGILEDLRTKITVDI